MRPGEALGATAKPVGEASWTVTVLTLFPDMFPGPLAHSLAGMALESALWRLQTVDIRAFARDKHRSVDDAPFGGGAGLVMRPDVIDAAMRDALAGGDDRRRRIYLTPRGVALTQSLVREIAAGPGSVVLCGRYEGVDQRAIDAWDFEEVSLGDFVLSGGEPAAMALIDACVRLLPGVVGSAESLGEESFEDGLLEYPHYTRPQTWRGRRVPEVLLSGHHERIRAWRLEQSRRITQERRRDLWGRYLERTGSRGG